jgi:hypothetical protein
MYRLLNRSCHEHLALSNNRVQHTLLCGNEDSKIHATSCNFVGLFIVFCKEARLPVSCPGVCLTNNFWTNQGIFMKLGLSIISQDTPPLYFLISYYQLHEYSGRANLWGGSDTSTTNVPVVTNTVLQRTKWSVFRNIRKFRVFTESGVCCILLSINETMAECRLTVPKLQVIRSTSTIPALHY